MILTTIQIAVVLYLLIAVGIYLFSRCILKLDNSRLLLGVSIGWALFLLALINSCNTDYNAGSVVTKVD